MKKHQLFIILCSLTVLLVTGCQKNNGNVWDDNQTAGNYKGSVRSLWGNSDQDQDSNFFGPTGEDFIALNDEDLRSAQFSDGAIPQPKADAGSRESGIPGIDGFHSPSGAEAAVFKAVRFGLDDHILRGKEYLAAVERIADYMKSHRDVYLFVEGHADERGPEAYNLSLGSRRSNYIRTLLVQKGVDSERIHTISYGKERPADLAHNQEAWSKNRRAEFKLFQK